MARNRDRAQRRKITGAQGAASLIAPPHRTGNRRATHPHDFHDFAHDLASLPG
jgi:hypothetical protein